MADIIMPTISGHGEPSTSSKSGGILGTMNGTWILDKRNGSSMRGYLETMGVTELAIQAHEKGDSDQETINIIEFTDDGEYFKIKKLSRVTDLTLTLKLGQVFRQTVSGDRVKTILATSDSPGRTIKIVSQMPTMNGVATVVDSKILQREGNMLVLVQTLVVRNERLGKEHTTVRYFLPHEGEVRAPHVQAK